MSRRQPALRLPTLDEIDTLLAKKSLREFVRVAWPVVEPGTVYVPGWHIDAICDHLEACTTGEIRNLIINIPPRHMKSLTVCVFWFCWVWASRPETRWIFSSYGDNLSIRDSLKCRRVIQSPWYQAAFGDVFRLTGDQNQKTRFENDKTGYRLATGVGGQATGEGGDFVVCLPYDALLTTDAGLLPIGRIVEEELPVNVATFNHDAKAVEYQPVLRYEVNPERLLIEIDLGDRILTCTEDHRVYVEGKGYVSAGQLEEGDTVLILE